MTTTTDIDLLQRIAKNSPELLEAARVSCPDDPGLHYRGSFTGQIISDEHAESLLGWAMVKDTWEAGYSPSPHYNHDTNQFVMVLGDSDDSSQFKGDSIFAALYSFYLAMKGEA